MGGKSRVIERLDKESTFGRFLGGLSSVSSFGKTSETPNGTSMPSGDGPCSNSRLHLFSNEFKSCKQEKSLVVPPEEARDLRFPREKSNCGNKMVAGILFVHRGEASQTSVRDG